MKTQETFNVRNESILDHNLDNASQALAEPELPLTEVLEKNPAEVLLALLTRTQPVAGIMTGGDDDFDDEEDDADDFDDDDDDDDFDDEDEADEDDAEVVEEDVEEEADEEWEMDEDFDEDDDEVDLDDDV